MKDQIEKFTLKKPNCLKQLVFFGILLLSSFSTMAQKELDQLISDVSEQLQNTIKDSLQLYRNAHRSVKLSEENNDKESLAASYRNLARWHMGNTSPDSTIYYLQAALGIYSENKLDGLQAATHLELEYAYKQHGEYNKALKEDFKAIKLYEGLEDQKGIAVVYTRLCDLLYYQQKYEEGADYCQKAIDIQSNLNVPEELAVSHRFKADNLLILERYDDALAEIDKAIATLKNAGKEDKVIAPNYNTRGNIYKYMKRYDEALAEYQRVYEIAGKNSDERAMIPALGNIGHVKRLQGKYADAIPFNLEAIEIMKRTGDTRNLSENYMHVSDCYTELGEYEKALKYERLFSGARFRNLEQTIQQLESELQIKYETAKKDETIEEQGATINRQRKIQLLSIGIALLLGFIVFGMIFTIRNIRKKRKALAALNLALEEKKKDVEESNAKLVKSLSDLKAAQTLLIHSEKMASLGELTAGIAHEIQNPLNFVNNFSEVSSELVDEMNEELEKGDFEEAKSIANDLQQNLKKINHHGKRADGIVKGMLQHSRKSSETKEPTDVNKLADEYLRLAYHGLRAKDKSFNATLETDYDENIGSILVFPQDLGRVILNLITNAFYACNERKSSLDEASKDAYKPTVTVSTKKLKDEVIISVKDNGGGIPKQVVDKIFQPFFTTKPTGEGTGLGLSMSYDIVTKGHGGELVVSTEEGQGTTFKIIIPK
jgi:signal transduction histidine kinase